MTDPYRQLGVAETADDSTIRAAYLAAVRACPPERDRQRFEQVRAAFEAIATRPKRLAHALFDTTPPTLQALAEALTDQWQAGRPAEPMLYHVLGRHD